MPISATGKQNSRIKQRGFTLLELLAVLLVIVLGYSLASLGVSSGGGEMRRDAAIARLADLSEYAIEEAQYRGVDLGLRLELARDRGEDRVVYRWMERADQGWRRIQPPLELLQPDQLPLDTRWQLSIEQQPVAELPRADREERAGLQAEPQIVFFASGETVPGSLEVRASDSGELLWLLEWDLLGRFTLLEGGLEPEVAP